MALQSLERHTRIVVLISLNSTGLWIIPMMTGCLGKADRLHPVVLYIFVFCLNVERTPIVLWFYPKCMVFFIDVSFRDLSIWKRNVLYCCLQKNKNKNTYLYLSFKKVPILCTNFTMVISLGMPCWIGCQKTRSCTN